MQKLIYATFLMLALASCKKSKVAAPTASMQGSYTGSFQRMGTTNDVRVSSVTLNFSLDKWSGQSDLSKYPALCNGTYKLTGDKISFENACVWTADFDWTLILSGEYELAQQGNSVSFTKSGANYKDVYTLTKK